MIIAELTRAEAEELRDDLNDLLKTLRDGEPDRPWRTVKLGFQGGEFKYKIGEGMWTPGIGHPLTYGTLVPTPQPQTGA